MALAKKEEQKVSAKVFSCVGFIAAIVLAVVGFACWKAGASTVSMINKSLVEEKIYFPEASEAYPDIDDYAGKQVTDGPSAKAFAEGLLAVQLDMLGNGKTGAEVAAAAAADPQNATLQQLQGVMFQLGTNKILLMNAHGAWTQGKMMQSAGLVVLVASGVLLVVAGMQYARYKR